MLVNSTVRLHAEKQTINYSAVWAPGIASASSATVTCVSHEGSTYLITNAHAVETSTYLKVKLDQSSAQLRVKAVWVDPVIDLAILAGESEEEMNFILKNVNPLPLNTVFQKKGTEVSVYGYASGGKILSFTKGNISRTELMPAAVSGMSTTLVQTSAAINPGNSGGPITKYKSETGTEECIGIVCQNQPSLQNTGSFIPASTLVQTIEAYKTYGKRGIFPFITQPTLIISAQELKNPVLREGLGMEKEALGEEPYGIYINNVPYRSCAHGLLNAGDILYSIDGYRIQADGMVKIEELEDPISFIYLVQRKKYLDTILVRVLRKDETGVLKELDIPIKLTKQLGHHLLGFHRQQPLKYYIHPSGRDAGFVFARCTQSLLAAYAAGAGGAARHRSTIAALNFTPELYEAVILHHVFPSEITEGYDAFAVSKMGQGVSRVVEANGLAIKSLEDLVIALSLNKEKTSSVTFDNGKVMYMAPEVGGVTTEYLKEKYKIAFFSSPSLAPVDKKPLLNQIQSLGTGDKNGNIQPSTLFKPRVVPSSAAVGVDARIPGDIPRGDINRIPEIELTGSQSVLQSGVACLVDCVSGNSHSFDSGLDDSFKDKDSESDMMPAPTKKLKI